MANGIDSELGGLLVPIVGTIVGDAVAIYGVGAAASRADRKD
jgi:hypothetical protein